MMLSLSHTLAGLFALANVALGLGIPSKSARNGTNSGFLYGSLDAPTIGPYLADHDASVHAFPWGDRDAYNSNPMTDAPDTGKTRRYHFTIARGKASPDGYEKDVILVNGQFPGPLIEANWGDTIEVTIQNKIADPPEGTAMHWHGLKQKKTPWYDGVPSVGQCPVAPGSSFTYRFQADSYGTTWYHSHYSAQFAGGLVGPLIVHGPKHAEYDYDLGPIMLGDYHHEDYYDILKRVVSVSTNFRTFIPTSDNNLINGRNPHNCSQVTDGRKCTPDAPMSKFRFQSGKVYRLRVINAGAAALQRFSIDGHRLQVIANDFSPIEPYETDVISLGVGQRSDVLVKAIGKPTDSYWMRSTIGRNCALARNFFAKAVVLYEDAPRNATPTTSPYFLPEVNCANDDLALTVPLYPITPDLSDVKTQVVGLTFGPNATGNNLFYVNNSTYRPNFNKPLLLLAHHQNSSYQYEPDWNVYDFGKAKRIRLVVNNLNSASHPMHIHGHNMFILAEGEGPWDGVTMNRIQNPQRRDTHMLRAFGHLVIQFEADNPGVWPFHCHNAWHQVGGMTLNILERPADIRQTQIPNVIAQTCRDWDEWTKRNVVREH